MYEIEKAVLSLEERRGRPTGRRPPETPEGGAGGDRGDHGAAPARAGQRSRYETRPRIMSSTPNARRSSPSPDISGAAIEVMFGKRSGGRLA